MYRHDPTGDGLDLLPIDSSYTMDTIAAIGELLRAIDADLARPSSSTVSLVRDRLARLAAVFAPEPRRRRWWQR